MRTLGPKQKASCRNGHQDSITPHSALNQAAMDLRIELLPRNETPRLAYSIISMYLVRTILGGYYAGAERERERG